MSEIMKGALGTKQKDENEDDDNKKEKKASDRSEYDYLLGMPMWNLTMEKVEELKKQLEQKKAELAEIIATAIEMMWDRDLTALLEQLDEQDRKEAKERGEEVDIKQA